MCYVWIIDIQRIKINTHSTLRLQRCRVRTVCVSERWRLMALSALLVPVATHRATAGAWRTGG